MPLICLKRKSVKRMSDEIIEELWRIKDGIAREHGYDVRRLATYLQSEKRVERERAVDVNDVPVTGKSVETTIEGL